MNKIHENQWYNFFYCMFRLCVNGIIVLNKKKLSSNVGVKATL